ncbi:MAG: hypothetical protein M3436_03095 [Pseudomonadota bacterium]|nr:hypothetical protein [Pseudomonadota bacterium]
MADNQDRANILQARINAAVQSDIPKINFNGIVTTLGTADITVVLERNGQPVALLNASYTAAKTLSVMLGNAIAQLEELSGQSIMTTAEVERFLAAVKPKEESTSTGAKRQKKSKPETEKVKH